VTGVKGGEGGVWKGKGGEVEGRSDGGQDFPSMPGVPGVARGFPSLRPCLSASAPVIPPCLPASRHASLPPAMPTCLPASLSARPCPLPPPPLPFHPTLTPPSLSPPLPSFPSTSLPSLPIPSFPSTPLPIPISIYEASISLKLNALNILARINFQFKMTAILHLDLHDF